jgi:hypothetical protein
MLQSVCLQELLYESRCYVVTLRVKGCGANVRSPYLPIIMEEGHLYAYHYYIAKGHSWHVCGQKSISGGDYGILYALCRDCAIKAGVIW